MSTKRVYLLPDAFRVNRQTLIDSETYFIDGSDAIFCPMHNTRYIDQTSCDEWPDLDGEVMLMTPGEVARTELTRAFPEAKFRARKSDFKLLDISQPMYFTGHQYHGPMYYLDLVGAYASIYRWLTLDCCWPRGVGEMWLGPVAARLWYNKPARNSLVGLTRTHNLTGVKGKKSTNVHFINRFFNPALWHTVLQVLHDLASRALRYGCIYISTDCYIFRKERDYRKMADYLASLCFDTHRYEGDGHIWGWGSYSLPGRKKQERHTDTRLFNISGDERSSEWLRRYISQP